LGQLESIPQVNLMILDRHSVLGKAEKVYLITRFMNRYPSLEIQDLYKWLYYGEFGYEEMNTFLTARKNIPRLQEILDDLSTEKELNITPPDVWEPMGCSHKFIMVYLTPYNDHNCPLLRIVNFMERSKAFSGSRMQFKLDWSIVKETALSLRPEWKKEDFYQFEDRIDFHSLPLLGFSETFLESHPYKYRVVSQKLFFEYFPEFYDSNKLFPPTKDSPIIG